MKKVIKHGDSKQRKVQCFKIECCKCGCIFTCSSEDFQWQELSINGRASVRCPDCNKEIEFRPCEHLFFEE